MSDEIFQTSCLFFMVARTGFEPVNVALRGQ